MNKECLQLRIGSCKGCNIFDMAENRTKRNNCNPDVVKEKFEKIFCPEGIGQMQSIALKRRGKC